MMEDDKTKLTWNLPRVLLPKNRVKLLLNLLLLAGGTIPRGGSLAIEPVGEGDTMGFKITSTGLNARIPPAVPALVAGDNGGNPVDAHAIQPFYHRPAGARLRNDGDACARGRNDRADGALSGRVRFRARANRRRWSINCKSNGIRRRRNAWGGYFSPSGAGSATNP